MVKRFIVIVSVVLAGTTLVSAQNTNSSTTQPSRTRTVAPKPSPTPKTVTKSTDTEASPTQKPKSTGAGQVAPSTGVLAAFDKIIDGVKHANVDTATSGYWKSSALVLFNYNGTVTKGWDQMRANRETSYPDMKDVKLDLRDKHVIMLGRDGAVVTCLWTQTMLFKGAPDSASGRMTLVFKRFGSDWKAVHLHTSMDKPDASRIPESEQTAMPSAKPTP